MKKAIKKLLCLAVMLLSANLFAKDFDWSECWCNYGGNIKKGDLMLSIDTGVTWDFFTPFNDGGWAIPALDVDLQVAAPIWKLPFSFGGYALLTAYNNANNTFWTFRFGSEVSYHVRMPPKNLDLYANLKAGMYIDFSDYYVNNFFLWPDFGGAVGAVWYFSNSFGVNAEIGYPINKIGITIKF